MGLFSSPDLPWAILQYIQVVIAAAGLQICQLSAELAWTKEKRRKDKNTVIVQL